MKIGIAYNLKEKPSAHLAPDFYEEFDAPETIDAIARALTSGGHEVVRLGWGIEVIDRIRSSGVEFVFNLAEGLRGRNRESLLPALFELLEIPYTGSDPLTLALTLEKVQAKRIVQSAGIKTPEYAVMASREEVAPLPPFPLFVKPLHEGSSKGIRLGSRVADREALREQIAWLDRSYGRMPVLVERYVAGREFTVGVLGNERPYLLGMMEIRFRDKARGDLVYSFEVKHDWENLCEYVVPPEMGRDLEGRLRDSAMRAYSVLGCRDVARLDFRVDAAGEVYFLEANPLPGLNPVSGDLVILARRVGWSYEKLILTILRHAEERCRGLKEAGKA